MAFILPWAQSRKLIMTHTQFDHKLIAELSQVSIDQKAAEIALAEAEMARLTDVIDSIPVTPAPLAWERVRRNSAGCILLRDLNAKQMNLYQELSAMLCTHKRLQVINWAAHNACGAVNLSLTDAELLISANH